MKRRRNDKTGLVNLDVDNYYVLAETTGDTIMKRYRLNSPNRYIRLINNNLHDSAAQSGAGAKKESEDRGRINSSPIFGDISAKRTRHPPTAEVGRWQALAGIACETNFRAIPETTTGRTILRRSGSNTGASA